MQRKLLGCCAFLLFATFGMLSGVAQAHHDEPIASSETIGLQVDVVPLQDMSPEEKERRREECQRMYDYCMEACDKRYPRPNQAAEKGRCQQECTDKIAECMKKIPSNPKEDPDY